MNEPDSSGRYEERRRYRLSAFQRELGAIVGPDHVSVDSAHLQAHARDASWMSKQADHIGASLPAPDWVVMPSSEHEVERIVSLAHQWRVPIVSRGGGSGSQGGTFAPYGGIGLNLTRLNSIVDIDERNLTVTAQAGIDGAVLESELNTRGYSMQHLPGSLNLGATLGGFLAARGSGVTSTKYGKAEDRVLGLRAVVPPGETVETIGVPSHAAGPDLLQLLVGSEGTLGIITQATMQIEPAPTERQFDAFEFNTVHEGIEAGRRIMTSRLRPAVLRLYDVADTAKIAAVLDMPLDGCLLVVICEGNDATGVAHELQAIQTVSLSAGGRSLGPSPAELWWSRKYVPFNSDHYPQLPVIFGTTDSCARFDDIARIYDERKVLFEEEFSEFNILYTAHFSHWYPWGTMIYDRFHVQNPPHDPEDALALHDILWNRATEIAVRNRGTINDHHGVGLKLGRFMPMQYGGSWRIMLAIKEAVDPRGILNPGKLGFGPPGTFE